MRKLINSLACFTAIALFVSIFSNITTTQAAFGTSPPCVKNYLLLPGSALEEVINLSRNETDTEMKVKIRTDGDEDLIKWITIEDRENLIMRTGQAILPMKVIINVPEDATPKSYTGSIFVTLSSVREGDSLGGGEVAIALGAHISVDISVISDEITDYEIKSASVEPMEEDDPFSIVVKVENTGNTNINDVEGQIEVYDRASDKTVKTLDFMPLNEPVSFNEIKEVEMVYKDYMPEIGEYWVAVKATKDGETAYEERFLQTVSAEIIPVITPEDVLNSSENDKATAIKKRNNIYLIFGMAGFGFALIAFIGIIAILVLKKRAKNNL